LICEEKETVIRRPKEKWPAPQNLVQS
jgi:hypothetical protein